MEKISSPLQSAPKTVVDESGNPIFGAIDSYNLFHFSLELNQVPIKVSQKQLHGKV